MVPYNEPPTCANLRCKSLHSYKPGQVNLDCSFQLAWLPQTIRFHTVRNLHDSQLLRVNVYCTVPSRQEHAQVLIDKPRLCSLTARKGAQPLWMGELTTAQFHMFTNIQKCFLSLQVSLGRTSSIQFGTHTGSYPFCFNLKRTVPQIYKHEQVL